MDFLTKFVAGGSPLKRFYKFILKRILGQFLQYDLDLAQLDVQLGKGEVVLKDLELNVQMLNELCVDLPITFIRARIRLVKATIPWRDLLTKPCLLQLDGWELVIVPSEQVQHKSSGTFSTMLAQSVLSEIDPRDVALQASLASLGQHFRPSDSFSSSSSAAPAGARRASGQATPMSMSSSGSAFASPARPGRGRDQREDEEEKRHEASTAAGVRARERRRKAVEERRRRREELGEDLDEEDDDDLGRDSQGVQVDSAGDTDDEDRGEEARAKRSHAARQAAAVDTANEGLRVVASFLEQVVSAIELEVTDVTLRIQHQPKVGTKQTTLLVKLPWVHFADLNKEAKVEQEQRADEEKKEAEVRAAERIARRESLRQQREAERAERAQAGGVLSPAELDSLAHEEDAEAEAEAEVEASIRRAFEAKLQRERSEDVRRTTTDGPKYEYHKSIRFHGFRVELQEESAIDSSYAQFPAAASSAKPSASLSEATLDDASTHSSLMSEPQTIISGSMDQTCMITLKLKMKETEADVPKLESTCFIQTLRALVTPKQLALLTDLSAAIGLSAKQVALNAQLAAQSTILPDPPLPNAAGGFSPSVAQATATSARPPTNSTTGASAFPAPVHGNTRRRSSGGGPAAGGHTPFTPFTPDEAGYYSHHTPKPTAGAAADAADQPVIHMWSLETHILQCNLTLTETDEQTWSTDWWLAGNNTSPQQPSMGAADAASSPSSPRTDIVQSVIPGIQSNHLCLSSHHTFINVTQTTAELTVKLTLGSIQLDEYLMQQPRTPQARRPSIADQPPEFVGYKARPLISFLTPLGPPRPEDAPHMQYPPTDAENFLQSTRTVAAPHFSMEYRNTVDTAGSLTFNEPPNLFFDPHPNSTVNSRITLSCQPATIDMDLGLGERLKNLLDAVSAPTAYLNAGTAAPMSARSETNSFTFDLQQRGPPPANGEEMVHELTSHQRRHSLEAHGVTSANDASSYAQVVIIAPTIHLNILFPVHTPSQQQPHPYTRLESMTQDPYIDARGSLRPERLSLELHEVSVANEVDLTAIPPVTDPLLNPSLLMEAEWKIRFHKAQVFMHFPHRTDGDDPQAAAAESLDDLEMVRKRIISTVYPTPHALSASSAYYSHASVASYISILQRASIVPGAPLRHTGGDAFARDGDSNFGGPDGQPPRGAPSVDSADEHQHHQNMFFDGLPNAKHWESETLNGERKRVFKMQTGDENAARFDERGQPIGGGGATSSQPDAAVFESLAIQNSSTVVTIHLPVASVHLAKYDYDLLMFLYTIFGEVMEPPPPSIEEPPPAMSAEDAHAMTAGFMQEVLPPAMYQSSLSSTQDEEEDRVDLNGLSRSSRYQRHPASSIMMRSGLDQGDSVDFDPDGPGSLSRSDSFSSDSSSEMFESVGGMDSVILRKHERTPQHHGGHRSKVAQYPVAPAEAGLHHGSLLQSSHSTANELAASADAHLSQQVRQYFVTRQPLTWLQLKRIILGVPHGMVGSAQQEAFMRGEHALSDWVRGVTPPQLPSRWHQHRQRLQVLFGDMQLTGEHTQALDPEDDDANTPLTMDSLGRRQFSGTEDDDHADSPAFPPTVGSSVSSRSSGHSPSHALMRSTILRPSGSHRSGGGHADEETNLSDAESADGSMPDDGGADSGMMEPEATVDHERDDPQAHQQAARRVAFGAESVVFGHSDPLSASASQELHRSPSESDSTELNPAAIFARASHTSGQSQLFQPPSMSMSTTLPPIREPEYAPTGQPMRTSQHLAQSRAQYGMHSSMMESVSHPEMFESFLPAPAGVFDPHASINPEMSIDYSHLPPAHRSALPHSQSAPLGFLPPAALTADALRRPLPSNVPFPLTASSAFPGRPAPPVATIAPSRLPSPWKHFLALRLNIQRASLCIQDDPPTAANQAAASAALPGQVPQTIHIDIGEVRLFQVAEFDGKPVTYIAIRAGDLTVREYKGVVTDDRQLFTTPSMPILFKTISEGATAAASPPPRMDAWGRPIRENEHKYEGDDLEQLSTSPLTSVYTRSPLDTASVAWSNPVLLINVVLKLQPQLHLRDTQAVINLRALTLQFEPKSQWIQKLMLFFTPTAYVPPALPPTFNVAAPAAPPPMPVTKDLTHIFLHGYDVSIDYNPANLAPRAVLSIDHVHLQTTVYPDSPVSELKLEVRDVAMFVVPQSSKAGYAPTMVLSELPQPFLHRVQAASLFAFLEQLGYARLATMDFLDATITQNSAKPTQPAAAASAPGVHPAHIPTLSVEVTNGILTLLTCWDSFQVFTDVCAHFAASIQEIQQVAEIDVRFDNEEAISFAAARQPSAGAYQITASNAVNSETSGGFTAKAFSTSHQHHQRAAYLLDDDEEEDEAQQGDRAHDAPEPKDSSSTPAAPTAGSLDSRNILAELDHNAFGADLGVAQVYTQDQSLEMKFNENYHDERHRQTSLSLALQAAAEREIARARREHELTNGGDDLGMSMYGLRRANSSSPPQAAAAASAIPIGDHSARWLSTRESEDLVEKDVYDAFIASLPDEASRAREEELAKEKEERRKRREEEREKAEGGRKKEKEARVPPKVIDDHVPLADEDTRTGRARLKPPADYPNAVSEILLLNLTVCWRMFGGQDWDMTAPPPNTSGKAAAGAPTARFLGPDDMPEVNSASMGTVDIIHFYDAPEPFVRPSATANPFASPYGARSVMSVPLPAGGFQASNAAHDSFHPSMARTGVTAPYGGVNPADVIPRGHRQTDRVMELLVKGASVRVDQFPGGTQIASRVVVALDDIEVHDLISTSPYKNFLCYYATGARGRELGSSMVRLELTSVRPDPSRPREEYRVKLSVLPLRLNVDQSAVEFFVQFFSHPPGSYGVEGPVAGASSASPDTASSRRSSYDDEDDGLTSAANFHAAYRDALTPAQVELLTSMSQYLQAGGSLPSSVRSAGEARDVLGHLLSKHKPHWTTQPRAADALGYHLTQFGEWMRGGPWDHTVGAKAVEVLNRLLPKASAAATGEQEEDDDEDSDGSDEELSSGIGGMVIGPGGGRSPLRRLSSDPMDTFQPFQIPPMPADWIPSTITRNHPHLTRALTEAYQKYYDVIHASMPETVVNTIEPWRPSPAQLALNHGESFNDYSTRVLSAARTAARTKLKMLHATGVREVDNQVYIQSFQVTSKILLCIDWNPNSFDLKGLQGGDWAQLANLLPLENMELSLRAVKMTGVTGFGRVGVELAKLWAYDLSRHQVHKFLAGVQPIRSMVNVGAGVADLVLLPITHYHQHGNLKRGVQRGLSSFLTNVSLESMSAAARLAQGAQSGLEWVDDVVTFAPTPLPAHAQQQFAHQRARGGARRGRGQDQSTSTVVDPRRRSGHMSKQAGAPSSIQDGFRQAYDSLSRGLQSAATQMIVVPRDEYNRYNSKGAFVKSALKSMPSAMLSPMIGGMEAIAKVLNGVTNSIDPARKKENQDKWKSPK